MPELTLRVTKREGGRHVTALVRMDGTVTTRRFTEANANFFVHHDLTHYAVESGLGHTRGFFGLVADGWNLSDFGAPWPRGRLPQDLDLTENIVGLFDSERASGRQWTAEEFNTALAQFHAMHPGFGALRPVTEAGLANIRAELTRLFRLWQDLPVGDTLELGFDRASLVPLSI
jgi:hypothetical protein